MAKATTKTATKATKKGVAKEDRSPEHVLRMDVSRARSKACLERSP